MELCACRVLRVEIEATVCPSPTQKMVEVPLLTLLHVGIVEYLRVTLPGRSPDLPITLLLSLVSDPFPLRSNKVYYCVSSKQPVS